MCSLGPRAAGRENRPPHPNETAVPPAAAISFYPVNSAVKEKTK